MGHREGFWQSKNEPHLPMPTTNVHWPERAAFVAALDRIERSKTVEMVGYRGWSMCRVCDKHNGSHEFFFRGWTWPEGYRHYIVEHGVRPSLAFQELIVDLAEEQPDPVDESIDRAVAEITESEDRHFVQGVTPITRTLSAKYSITPDSVDAFINGVEPASNKTIDSDEEFMRALEEPLDRPRQKISAKSDKLKSGRRKRDGGGF